MTLHLPQRGWGVLIPKSPRGYATVLD